MTHHQRAKQIPQKGAVYLLQVHYNTGGFYGSTRYTNYLTSDSFRPFTWSTSCCSNQVFPSTTCTYYCVLLKIAGSLLQEMCSIHPGQSLASSIKARHHADTGETQDNRDIVFFRDSLDFRSQHPKFSILVRMVITSNCGTVETIELWCQKYAAENRKKISKDIYFSAKCISEHNGLST